MTLFDFEKTVPYVKKNGIVGYFQLIRHNISDLIILNLLFVFTSIPIITIGPSILALNQMTMAMVRDIPTSFAKDYFAYFKKCFLDGIICGAVFFLCVAISAFSFTYYFTWGKTVQPMYIFCLIALICFLLIFIAASFFFPMYSCVHLKKRILLKNSILLSISYLKYSLAVLGLIALFMIMISALFPYSLPFIAVGPISFISLAACYVSWNPINRHVIKND